MYFTAWLNFDNKTKTCFVICNPKMAIQPCFSLLLSSIVIIIIITTIIILQYMEQTCDFLLC